MDCIVHGAAKSQTLLSDFHFALPKKKKSEIQYDKSMFAYLISHWLISNVSEEIIYIHFCSPHAWHIVNT